MRPSYAALPERKLNEAAEPVQRKDRGGGLDAAAVAAAIVLVPLTVAFNVTNRPAGPLGPATPAGYGLTYTDVAFRTADGVRLSAWYVPARNGAAVVLLPGAGSTRTTLLGQAAVLARHGYGALLADTRGHGASGGHAMDFGWWGDRALAAAVSFLASQPGVHAGKIAVLGESMGGEQALAAYVRQEQHRQPRLPSRSTTRPP